MENRLLEVAKKTGIHVPIEFVEKLSTSTAGACQVNNDNQSITVLLSIPGMKYQTRELERRIGRVIDAFDVGQMVLHHELFHAYDEQTTHRLSMANVYYVKSMNSAARGNRLGLYRNFRKYKTIHYQCEQRAWAYAEQYVPKQLKEVFHLLVEDGLKSYRDYYKRELKIMWKSYRLLKAFQTRMKENLCTSFSVDISSTETEKTIYDPSNDSYTMMVPRLLRRKPFGLNLTETNYMFFESLYLFFKQKYNKNTSPALEEEFYRVLYEENQAEAAKEALERYTVVQTSEFSWIMEQMEQGFSGSEPHFATFKAYYERENDYTLEQMNRRLTRAMRSIQEQKVG